jgi:hypothetical protein
MTHCPQRGDPPLGLEQLGVARCPDAAAREGNPAPIIVAVSLEGERSISDR